MPARLLGPNVCKNELKNKKKAWNHNEIGSMV